ncbi:isochorismatase [Diplocarpon rosae]|nr:isochorismatase [Diplocarpon rosae]
MATDFRPALIIVDLQNDFCPPVHQQNGSLAVTNGRDIIPVVNKLLSLPFILKIATKDWHPPDHISFASNHAGKRAFVDTTTIFNPCNRAENYESRLWPDHCIQDTPGAALVSELHAEKLDRVVEKGQRREVEMYSAFYDPLQSPRCSDSGLAKVLMEEGITDVYVVGLAFDYCVKATAVDARKEGYATVVVRDGTRAVEEGNWEKVCGELEELGIRVVGVEGEEVRRVGRNES